MNETLDFLVRHGAAVLFVAVFIEQMGVPLPAAPWLLAAGASAGAGKLHWFAALNAAIVGSIVADMIWFQLGRHGGQRMLSLLCRISLEPDSCVRRTQGLFTRYGMRGVVGAKFIPGLSTLIPPLAGNAGVSIPRFLFFDGLGALLYTGFFMLLGVAFSQQLEQIIGALAGLGHSALAVVVGLVALYVGRKFYQRRRLLNELKTARITVDELHNKQEAGEDMLILDLRSQEELTHNPQVIRGALHISMDEMEGRHHEIPRDREIILYCSCPNEVSSARVALMLHRQGIVRVRPLLGGIDAWRARNYPLDDKSAALAANPITTITT
ncbi:MAG TPA: rhodanese-like domain-containing protein [Candidatus Saccharimonadales bacterium]|nr:rhodanese-like domain-containing protein [Candidatus Saccharimonadales bacterium]